MPRFTQPFSGSPRHIALLAATTIALIARPLCSAQAAELDQAMLRFPDVSADKVCFVFDNDVWVGPKAGGQAWPLSSPPGGESFPRFSPDGGSIAYSAQYDGNGDVYE